MTAWISVEDRMPEELEEVMFFYVIYGKDLFGEGLKSSEEALKKDIVCGHVAKGIWHICYLYTSMPLNERVHITHWMPLPENPL